MKEKLLKKAKQSACRYKVAAIGIDKRGNVIGVAHNMPKLRRKGGSLHAEERLMNRYGKVLHTIIICRTNKNGRWLLPIEPCGKCRRRAERLGIKIVTISRGKQRKGDANETDS